MYVKKVTLEVRQAVFLRDLKQMGKTGLHRCKGPICIASVVDRSESVNCWGRSTLDHVKDDPRMGKRATSDEQHLVTLCQGHTEDGRKAGHQWNTANRPALRQYLKERYA